MFTKKKLDSYFYKTKGFYIFFIPVKVPYKQIYSLADSAGLKKKEAFGPIFERGSLFGSGWIGVEVEKPSDNRQDVIHVAGDFETYEHKGPYKNIGKACQKIRKERPSSKEFYNMYMDDPDKVRPDDLRTLIFFR
ncbi:MAG: hypothetical protein IPM97_00165 [Bdellovibrionaceae bacterium]|nr:hypothetical protein [Pseudobdellovibrionaceae bacterium]